MEQIKLNNEFDIFYNLLKEINKERLYLYTCEYYVINEKLLIKLINKTLSDVEYKFYLSIYFN
jgi:hypothetical protein